MGKRAATKVQAGAEGTGRIREVEALPHAPKLELVNSPKRVKILVGMLEAVGAEGYDATSVRTILDRTGLYRQAFYDNFADKDSCYLAALEMGIARLEALVVKAAASEESWRGRLRAGLGALLDQLDAEPDLGRGVIVEVHAAGPEALARRAEAMKKAADFIDLARLEADESESPPQIAPEGIVAGIHAIVHSRLSTGACDGFRDLLPEFMYFAVLPYFDADAASAEMQAARA
jgi:AcrR family transcriptional regulator